MLEGACDNNCDNEKDSSKMKCDESVASAPSLACPLLLLLE